MARWPTNIKVSHQIRSLVLGFIDMKCEVSKYQEMLESREALISATGFALNHVIEQAKIELGNLYANQNQTSGEVASAV
jgi:hypothetical protein